jgi:predicted RNA-binding protein associated with RNAse of E/G family
LETLDLIIDVLVALDVEAELLDNDFDGEEILPE